MSFPTRSPTPITDAGCLDFATSQNCRLSDVICNISFGPYLHTCHCQFEDKDCGELRAGQGDGVLKYSLRCPCPLPPSSVSATTVFIIVLAFLVTACCLRVFSTRRVTNYVEKRKVAVSQDPTTLTLATENDYAAWRDWEANMRNFEETLAQRTQGAPTSPEGLNGGDNIVAISLDSSESEQHVELNDASPMALASGAFDRESDEHLHEHNLVTVALDSPVTEANTDFHSSELNSSHKGPKQQDNEPVIQNASSGAE